MGPRGGLWLPALLLAAFVFLNVGGWWYYRQTESRMVDAVGQRLLRSTSYVVRRLDMYQLEVWRDPFLPDSATRQFVGRMMEDLKSSDELETFELFTPLGAEWTLALDDSLAPIEPAPLAAGAAFDSAALGTPFVSDLYRSLGEYYLAACIPIYDFDSTIGAVAIAEAGHEYFGSLRNLRSGLLVLDGFAGLLLLTIGLIWAGVQRRLVRAEAAARRSAQLAAMGQMVATVAHELKNPLGIIKNTAERIRKKHGSDGDPIFDFIPQEVDRLDQLLKRYLQFARVEIAHADDVDLSLVTDKLQSQLAAGDGTPTFLVRVPDGLSVSADPDALRQVLLNLVLNATEACTRVGGGEVHLSALRKGENVEIVVSDTGGGMDAETLRRVAEPFFTTRPDGSGLGIYLAQTLTEKMAGRMFIRSREGEGTSVSIVLPAADTTAKGT
jgi:signal transduction histidine kinase